MVFMCRVALSAMAAVGLKFLKFVVSQGIMIDYLSFLQACLITISKRPDKQPGTRQERAGYLYERNIFPPYLP
jgi:hypothetical protein